MGLWNPFNLQASTLPSQHDLLDMDCSLKYGLFDAKAAVCMHVVPAQPHLHCPLRKSPYVASTLQLRATDWLSAHSTSPKGKKSFSVRVVHSLPVPLTVLGDRISLLNSPCWHCSYGHSACCVCNLSLPDFLCSPKSLLVRVVGSLCSLLCCRHLAQGMSSSTYKISYKMVQSFLCTPWLQKFISAKIPLIIQVTC